MTVTIDVTSGSASNPNCYSSSYSYPSRCHRLQRYQLLSVLLTTSRGRRRPLSVSSYVFSAFCEPFAYWQNTGEVGVCDPNAGPAEANPNRVISRGQSDLTFAPTPSEIRCAGTAASERRPCGRAKGSNSRLGCWPRPHAASSSRQMLSRLRGRGVAFEDESVAQVGVIRFKRLLRGGARKQRRHDRSVRVIVIHGWQAPTAPPWCEPCLR